MARSVAGLGVVLTAAVLILTIIGYTSDHGMFKDHTSGTFGIFDGTARIGFFHEQFDVSGNTDDTTDFSCGAASNSKCKDDYVDNARQAAQTALVLSIVSFALSLFFVPLFIGVTTRLLAIGQLCIQIGFIIACVTAFYRLRQFFQYQLDISSSDIDYQYGSECWVAAAVGMAIAAVFTLFGPLIGLCWVAEPAPSRWWRV
jgi:hypothetical protein